MNIFGLNGWGLVRRARHFLRVYTKDVLHLDSTTTSRDEGMIKRDLEVSTNDFLTSLRSMERTLTHQHRKVIDEIEQEKVNISVSHRILLFREVIGKISSTALAKALALRNNYLPVGAPGTLYGFGKGECRDPMHSRDSRGV